MATREKREDLLDVFAKGSAFTIRYSDGPKTQKVEQQWGTVVRVNKRQRLATVRTNRSVKVGRTRRGRPRWVAVEIGVWLDEVKQTGKKTYVWDETKFYLQRLGVDPLAGVTFDLVDKDRPYDGRLYRVLRDGDEIGWVESHETTNDRAIAGTRLRRVGARVTRWHVARTRRGLHSRDERIGYLHDTRKEAVEALLERLGREN